MSRAQGQTGQIDDQAADVESERYSIPLRFYVIGVRKAYKLEIAIIFGCVLLAVLYLALRQPSYSAIAVIGPTAVSANGASNSISALASTAGFNIGTASSTVFDKYQHLLQATRLAVSLEERHGVMRHLYAPLWDAQNQKWKSSSGLMSDILAPYFALSNQTGRPPSTQGLAERLRKMIIVHQADAQTGGLAALKSQIVTVTLRYKDRDYAIALLNYALMDADELERQDQLAETENRINYLADAIKSTSAVSLNTTLTQILGDQERVLMMVKADKYYAFDMIDPPNASLIPDGMSKARVLMLSVVLGLVLSGAAVFLMVRWRVARYVETGEEPFARPFSDPAGGLMNLIKSRVARLRGKRQNPNVESPHSILP